LSPNSVSQWLSQGDIDLSISILNTSSRGDESKTIPFLVQMRQLAAPPRFMQDLDLSILNALLDKDVAWQQKSSYNILPNGRFYQNLLDTGRIYWDDSDVPLVWAKSVPTSKVEWATNRQGQQELRLNVKGAQVIIVAEQLYAVMESGCVLAKIEGQLSQEALNIITNNIRLNPESVNDFIHRNQDEFTFTYDLPR